MSTPKDDCPPQVSAATEQDTPPIPLTVPAGDHFPSREELLVFHTELTAGGYLEEGWTAYAEKIRNALRKEHTLILVGVFRMEGALQSQAKKRKEMEEPLSTEGA